MILFGDKISQMPRWLRGLVLTCSALLLTLGFSLAQEPGDLDRVQEWLDSGVNSAFLTAEQAEIMMNSLRASERGSDFDLVDADGNFIIMKRQVTGDGEEVIIDVEFDGDPSSPDPLAFAERSIQERVAAGEISQAEADTFLAELNNAFARDGSVNVRTVKMLGVDGESIEVVSEDSNVIRVVRKGPPN